MTTVVPLVAIDRLDPETRRAWVDLCAREVRRLDAKRQRSWDEDFVDAVRGTIGWPVILWRDHDSYSIDVRVLGARVMRLDDADVARLPRQADIAGVVVGMRIREAWWGSRE